MSIMISPQLHKELYQDDRQDQNVTVICKISFSPHLARTTQPGRLGDFVPKTCLRCTSVLKKS